VNRTLNYVTLKYMLTTDKGLEKLVQLGFPNSVAFSEQSNAVVLAICRKPQLLDVGYWWGTARLIEQGFLRDLTKQEELLYTLSGQIDGGNS